MTTFHSTRTPQSRSARARIGAAFASLVALVVLAAPAAASDRWFHVQVDDHNGGAEVSVNLPLSLIESAFKLIPEDVSEDVSNDLQVELNDAGFSIDELRTLWDEIRYGEDATYITVREEDTSFAVRKSGDFLLVESDETSTTQIEVRFPLPVVDALFSGGDNRLDFAAAIQALADYGEGDMITVRDQDATVRVWVDGVNGN